MAGNVVGVYEWDMHGLEAFVRFATVALSQ